jgi:protein-tyrosine phosphatase
MTHSILFVCLGNICRSPTAEAVFRAAALHEGLEVHVDSAGTSGWHIGQPPDPRAQAAASAKGYDLSGLRGRRVTPEDFGKFDLILAMDRANLSKLRATRPRGGRAKVCLFLDYAQDRQEREVPDPYYDDRFDYVLELLEDASRGLLGSLASA